MGKRLDLHELLVNILGTRNVYFQPPPSVSMKYPAIRYSLSNIENVHADNAVYGTNKSYEITYLTTNPDDEIVDKLNTLPQCGFDRHYVSDNLYHYVFELYF